MNEVIEDIFTLWIPCILSILFSLALELIYLILQAIVWLGIGFIIFAPFIGFMISDGFK